MNVNDAFALTCAAGLPVVLFDHAGLTMTNTIGNTFVSGDIVQGGHTFNFTVDSDIPFSATYPLFGTGNFSGGNLNGGLELLANNNQTPTVTVTLNISPTPSRLEVHANDIEEGPEAVSIGTTHTSAVPHPGAIIDINSAAGIITGIDENVFGGTERTAIVTYDNVSNFTWTYTNANTQFGAGFSIAAFCEAINSDIEVVKSADKTTNVPLGEVVTYSYQVTNTGNVTVTNIQLDDIHNGSGPVPIPTGETLTTDAGTIGDSTDSGINGVWEVLAPDDIVTFTGFYTVTQSDVDLLQ